MAKMIKIKSAAADGFEFGAYHAEAEGARRGGVQGRAWRPKDTSKPTLQ